MHSEVGRRESLSMEGAIAIRSEIRTCLQQKGYTLRSFADLSGVTVSYLSTLLNVDKIKPISVRYIDVIASALGQPEGWLYELYVEECFVTGSPHRSRIKPFLLRCVEIGLTDCIIVVLSRMLEDLNQLELVFEIAEELHNADKPKEAVPFYECIVENEKYQHSERLAISHYRLFRAALGQNLEKNREAAIRFAPFRNRLPVNYQLDGYYKLTGTSFNQHKWDEVEVYADEFQIVVKAACNDKIRRLESKKKAEPLVTDHPFVFYYGYSYLMKSLALQKQKKYKEAKAYIYKYNDLSWMKGMDKKNQKQVEQFKLWAEGNMYTLDILTNKRSVIPRYIQYLKEHPDEILAGLLTILESANNYDFFVDELLEEFREQISKFNKLSDKTHRTYYFSFLHELAIYNFKNERMHQGLNCTLHSLRLAIIMNNDSDFKQCVTMFELNKKFATAEQKNEYESIIKEEGNDEKFSNCSSRSGFWVN